MPRPKGTPAELERRRLRAVKLLDEGYQPVEVARMIGVDRRSVRRWKAAYREGGVDGVAAVKASGRPPKLEPEERERLARIILQGARAEGFSTDLWTCPRVVRVIRKHFGVDYHPDHVGRILHALGFTPQKPQRRAAERDEEAIARWIRRDWGPAKKKSDP